MLNKRQLNILGIRGIPARHGGFETFAEKLCLYLSDKGWDVTVYCQEEGKGGVYESNWQGVRRIHIPVTGDGALGSIFFDWKVAIHAMNRPGMFLLLGYNTAVFNSLQRLKKQITIINMDGIEWRRDKWGMLAKAWFWVNERVGCLIGNHLVADHPRIKDHLATRVCSDKITMIPYGADAVTNADANLLESYGIKSNHFSVIIARPEPENSFLEMVCAFSRKKRNHKLVVLGKFDAEKNSFHRSVIDSASEEVVFPGAIYDQHIVQALRYHSRFYLHGHRVGGTNPSLVEALGAGSAVIAHDNQYNRWVAGECAVYFKDEDSCDFLLDRILHDHDARAEMSEGSNIQFRERFMWQKILGEYEQLLLDWYPLK